MCSQIIISNCARITPAWYPSRCAPFLCDHKFVLTATHDLCPVATALRLEIACRLCSSTLCLVHDVLSAQLTVRSMIVMRNLTTDYVTDYSHPKSSEHMCEALHMFHTEHG